MGQIRDINQALEEDSRALAWNTFEDQHAARQATLREMKSNGVDCVVKLDRLQVECREDPRPGLRELPGYKRGHSVYPRMHYNDRELGYAWAQWFQRTRSGTKFNIEGQPRRGYLSPWRVTLVADDSTGLTGKQVRAVLKVIPDFKLTLVEIAFDFAIQPEQRGLLMRSVLFGKSRPARIYRGTHYWGTRKGAKLVRAYWKNGKFRIELELHARFLRYYGIESISDFSKLATLLPHTHLWFARLQTEKLHGYLQRRGYRPAEIARIGSELARFCTNLFSLAYGIRLEAEMQNARRVLVPVWLNRIVRDAADKWARSWQTRAIGRAIKRH